MFVVVILPVLEVYFVALILIFSISILTIKEKQIWSPEAVTRIFNYSQIYTKLNKPSAFCNFLLNS